MKCVRGRGTSAATRAEVVRCEQYARRFLWERAFELVQHQPITIDAQALFEHRRTGHVPA